MKKYSIYLMMILLAGLVGCEKELFLSEKEDAGDSDGNISYYVQNRKTVPIYHGVSKVNDRIRFEDIGAFEKAFKLMQSEDDVINTRFLDDWGHLTEDKLFEKEKDLGFHEDIAMIYFESKFGHQSLRKKIDQLEQSWLAANEPDPAADPNDHVVQDRILRTFFNEDNEVMIGESIYKIMDNGVVYEVTDGDDATATQISPIHANTAFQAKNVILHNEELLGSAKSLFGNCRILPSGRTSWQYYNGGTRKYRGYLGLRNFVFYTGVLSTTTSYRRINGKWKKRRGSLRTRNHGQINFGDSDCLGSKTNYNSKQKSKYRRHIEKRYMLYFGVPNPSMIARCQSGWLSSNHYCNGSDIDYNLIW